MAWKTISSINTRYGYTKLQYDDSSVAVNRSARVIFELNQGGFIDAYFYDLTIDGTNRGSPRVRLEGSGTLTLWSGTLGAGSRSVLFHVNWFDIGARYYGGSGIVPSAYSAPTGVSGTNNAGNGSEGVANSTVSLTSWGINSAQYQWIINRSTSEGSANRFAESTSSGTMSWNIPNYSSSTAAGVVTTWYPEAKNNNALYAFGAAKYITSPSAPVISASGSVSTNPKCTITGKCSYSGGQNNSTSDDTARMHTWRLKYGPTDGSLTTISSADTSKTKTFSAIGNANFITGKDYIFYVNPTNAYGGYSTNNAIIYCPQGLSISSSNISTTSFTLSGKCQYAGDLNNFRGGSVACYQFSYSTDQQTWTSTSIQTNASVSISGLSPNTTYYCKVKIWNKYGLSQTTSAIAVSTLRRYVPIIGNLNVVALTSGVGLGVTVPITHPGGQSLDAGTVSTITLYYKKSSQSAWTQLTQATGLSLAAGSSYTFSNAHTGAFNEEGDYNIKAVASNGVDNGTSSVVTISAPSSVTISSTSLNTPIRISATGTAVGSNIYQWTISVGTSNEKSKNSSLTTETLLSVNYLNYDTTYPVYLKAMNKFGAWRKSNPINVKTEKRIKWFLSNQDGSQNVGVSFVGKNNVSTNNITEVYFVKKNALGNLANGSSLANMRLTFIDRPLHYRAENVASFGLSNGKSIAFKYDASADTYKFGIWGGDTIETTFFNGYEWSVDHYDFGPSDLTITSSQSIRGMNSSAAFSTTTCTEIPLWER